MVKKKWMGAVYLDGTTRTAAKFQEWRSGRTFIENCELEPRLQYIDESYIDIIMKGTDTYMVHIESTEELFPMILDAEMCLWNNHSKHHYDAGEVRK